MVLCCKLSSHWLHGYIFVLFTISQMHYPSNQCRKFILSTITSPVHHTILRMYTEDTVFNEVPSITRANLSKWLYVFQKKKQHSFVKQNINLGKWLFWVDDALATNVVALFCTCLIIFTCVPFYYHGLTEIWACTSNHMNCFMWNTITHPWPNFNAA